MNEYMIQIVNEVQRSVESLIPKESLDNKYDICMDFALEIIEEKINLDELHKYIDDNINVFIKDYLRLNEIPCGLHIGKR